MPTTGKHIYRTIIWPFAIAETILWAASYYAFPAFLLQWEAEFGWSKTALVSALTTALVLSALSAPIVGRLIDRGYAKIVFTTCSITASILLVLLSWVTEFWQFFTLWACLGLVMSGMLYEACFSVLTRALGSDAKRAITLVTLLAGLAGTLSFPAAYYLSALIGWRSALLIYAAAVATISLPLVWTACTNADRHHALNLVAATLQATTVKSVLRTASFWLLAFALMTTAISHGAIIPHLLPILAEYKVDPDTAVFAAAMIGPMQVTGRLAMMAGERHVSIFAIGNVSFIAMSIAALALLYTGSVEGLLILFVILQGAANGVISIVKPVIILKVHGRSGFGTTSGMIAVPFLLGFAFGPTLAAMIWDIGGYTMVLKLTFATTLFGLLALLSVQHIARKNGAK